MNWKEISRRKLDSFYELPESEWAIFEEYGSVGDIWKLEIEVKIELEAIPYEYLFNLFVDSLENNRYEESEHIKAEFIRRSYKVSIEIQSKSKGVLTISKGF